MLEEVGSHRWVLMAVQELSMKGLAAAVGPVLLLLPRQARFRRGEQGFHPLGKQDRRLLTVAAVVVVVALVLVLELTVVVTEESMRLEYPQQQIAAAVAVALLRVIVAVMAVLVL